MSPFTSIKQVAAATLVCAALAGNTVAAPTTAPAKKPVATAKPAAPAVKPAPRTLDAIQIEGEIDVPQVLFIQARDRRRFRDGTGKGYLAGATDVARCTMPDRLRVVARPETVKEEEK